MTPFTGFSRETTSFFKELAQNNQRSWFDANRERYQQQVIAPAQAFVLAMGNRLSRLAPSIIADPRSNGSGSIYRIHRDVRFSKDKTPYKTNLGIFFWHGAPVKGNQPGFYFHLEAEYLALYAGSYVFEKSILDRYRQAVAHPDKGRQLLREVQKLESSGGYQVGGSHYKRIPKGYREEQDPRDFLLYNTFYVQYGSTLPKELYSTDLVDYCYGHFKKMYPVLKWLIGLYDDRSERSPVI
jgi:uncharacterized protein (TIGR02453 family)